VISDANLSRVRTVRCCLCGLTKRKPIHRFKRRLPVLFRVMCRKILCLVLTFLSAAPVGAIAASQEAVIELAALVPRARPPKGVAHREPPAAGICRLIEAAAHDADLEAPFFARLIWQESLFDPNAVSPVGAQGIAQFMPGTAALRGLEDAFDPEKALKASALYLADLLRDFGNLGLAAAAYNGGEARMARYVAEGSDLPGETRAYVTAITGIAVEDWRDAPPKALDLSLSGANFHEGCLALAASGRPRTPQAAPPPPWGVVIASGRDSDSVRRQATRVMNRHAPVLQGEAVHYGRNGRLGRARGLMVAQVGRESRDAAETLCTRIHLVGGDCIVLRN
jgi:hypothetical protein